MVWQVLVAGKHTVTEVNASFTVRKLCGAGPESTTMACRLVGGGPSGFTVTVAVPDLLLSCVEVAVMVTTNDESPPEGALNKPELEMVPALAIHVTPELKFPVPNTVAEHWLVWPNRMVEGEQVTVTDVIADAPLPPPPQAAISVRLASTSNSHSFCTIVLP
jgi:hypothetical protein